MVDSEIPSFDERHQQPILTAATQPLHTDTAMPLGRYIPREHQRVVFLTNGVADFTQPALVY